MHQRLGESLAPDTRRQFRTVRGQSTGHEYWSRGLHNLACAGEGIESRKGFARTQGVPDSMGDTVAGLGQYIEAAAALASKFTDGGAPAGGPSAIGPTTGMPTPGSTATAVSPTFQTQISPQISPTFQQTQASPGAVQAATATQYIPGGMMAKGGSAAAAPPLSPYGPSFPDFGASGPTKFGGLPVSSLDPVQFTDIRRFPTAGSDIARINESIPFNWTPVYWIGGVALVGVLALVFMKQRKR